ncbi:MAG: autoinducer binding domain-containing protein [Alphaproteobacteria bacterium]
MVIEEFIEASNKAQTVDQLFELYKQAMHRLGFDRIIFSLMTDHVSIQRQAGHGIMLNYSEDWMKYYVENNCEVYDPVRRFMYSSPGAFTWEGLMEKPLHSDKQRVFMKEGDEAGMHDGIGVPLRGPRGAIAGVGAASSSGGVELADKKVMAYVNLLSHQFYTVYLTLEAQRLTKGDQPVIRLSDREQEVLKWCARGKTKSEISDILGLSEHTVHTYIKDALKKLDANNMTLGVLKALQSGLIQL